MSRPIRFRRLDRRAAASRVIAIGAAVVATLAARVHAGNTASIINVLVDGGSSTTVCGGHVVDLSITYQISPGGLVAATQATINNVSRCYNHSDIQNTQASPIIRTVGFRVATPTTPGTFAIVITGFEDNGCTSATTAANSSTSVTLLATGSCPITADDEVCRGTIGLAASIAPQGPNAEYTWSILGRDLSTTIISGQGTPSIVYQVGQELGESSVSLHVTVTESGTCVCAGQKTVLLVDNPVATAANNGPLCVGQMLQLTGGPDGMASYHWTGPNNFESFQQHPTIANVQSIHSGDYQLSVVAPGGCQASVVTVVSVTTGLSMTAANDGPVCPGGTIHLTGEPSGLASYLWTGPGGFTSTEQNPTLTNVGTAQSGIYTLRGTSQSGCEGTATTTVNVRTPPAATASSNSPVCVGGTLNLLGGPSGAGYGYAWTGPDGFMSTLRNPSIPNVMMVHAGQYTLTVTDQFGCQGSASTNVTVTAGINATATNNGPVCVGTTVFLAGGPSGMSTYQWTGPNGWSSFQQNPSVPGTLAAAGTYTLQVTAPGGCQGMASTDVAVNPAPLASLPVGAVQATVCSGESTDITVGSSEVGVNYQLRKSAGNVNVGSPVPGTGGTIDLPTGPLTLPTTFNVLATNATTGCSRQLTGTKSIGVTVGASITLQPLDVLVSLTPTSTSPTATFLIQATGSGLTYQWQVSTDGGATFSDVAGGTGATTARYTTPPLTAADNGSRYRCVVTGACGTLASSAARLTVQGSTTPPSPDPAPTPSPNLNPGPGGTPGPCPNGTPLFAGLCGGACATGLAVTLLLLGGVRVSARHRTARRRT